ncbi:MAG: LPS export ABC transporter permease LptG [Pseudomonadota bacterium]
MRLIAGYLMRTVVGGAGLTLLVLLALAGFIEFVGQMDDTGTGTYTTLGALLYTTLRMPLLGVDMMPVASLLGALLGLGALAGNSELIAMRAAGISAWRLAGAVVATGLVLSIGSAVIAEYLAPPMDQFARKYRSAARSDSELTGTQNTWVRDGDTIFNVESNDGQLRFGGVFVFELNSRDGLQAVGRATQAELSGEEGWVLQNYAETRFDGYAVEAEAEDQRLQRFNVDAELLGIAALRPRSLSITGLLAYLSYLDNNELDNRSYATELWRRVGDAIAVVLMPVLALGFVFGSLRRSGAGARLLLGVLIGLAYFLVSRTLSSSGQVYALNPALVGLAPALLLFIATVISVRRIR